MANDSEIVDIVDESGYILRQELKVDAHKHGWLHKCVIGQLRYGDDWALVVQAGDRQDAGQLVAPVGGHVAAGETDIAALLRESEEEIGVRDITYKHVGTTRFHRQVIGRDENHLFVVYEISTEDPITLGSEAISIERFSPGELKQTLINTPERFGDAFCAQLELFYPSYLPANWNWRWL